MTTIRPFSAHYSTNVSRIRDQTHMNPCVLCGKNVINPAGYLNVAGGGGTFVMPDYEGDNDPGYMGFHAIGSDCLRRNPELKPYLVQR